MSLPPLLRAARRLAAARPEARRFAARACLVAPLVRVSLALVGLRSTLRWIDATPTRGFRETEPVGVDEGRVLVQGVFRVHLMGGECLHQSLVQYLVHRRDGLAMRLVLGVKRPGGSRAIAAHAWVEEAEGRALSRSGDPTFVPLFVSVAERQETRGIMGGGLRGRSGASANG